MSARVANSRDFAQEVGCRYGTGAALIMEPDLVGHRMVAENDRELVPFFADFPATVEQFGTTNVPTTVPADASARRAPQNLFVSRDPGDPLFGQQRDHCLTDRPLGWPH